jgi:diguanylate cyclase (GGDEF)-like protein/PAS domain S-box-containing protein
MSDRSELIEAALDSFPEGLVLLDREDAVAFWNRAAERITGYPSIEVLTRLVPWALEPLLSDNALLAEADTVAAKPHERGTLIRARDRRGCELPLMMRTLVLRDGLGERIGKAAIFHLATGLDSLPHGQSSEESDLDAAQDEIEEQVRAAHEDYERGGAPLGLLWITVDQAHEMRKTHGAKACDSMLERVERTLTNGLRPADEIGRWGDDEFLILSRASTPELLGAHAQALAGLARTSDFRWWGDRLTLSVSVGAAEARKTETLPRLFERAQAAMLASVHAGGNHFTLAPER